MPVNDDLRGRYLAESIHEHERSLAIVCPGCRETHYIRVWHDGTQGQMPQWGFNGDFDKPVFTPSLLVRTYRYKDLGDNDAEFDRVMAQGFDAITASQFGVRCHTFIGCNGAQPGEIIFLGDCTHDHAGRVVPLVDIAQWRAEREARYKAALASNLASNAPALKPAPGAGSPMENGKWRPA